MVAVAIVYAGLASMFVGLVCLVHPLTFLGLHTRKTAAMILIGGIIILAVGTSLPAPETRVELAQSELDRVIPVYQFSEFHSIRILASRPAAYSALKQVTPGEIFLYRTLVWLRRFGRSGPPSILNPPPDRPLIEVAASTSFLPLADIPGDQPNSEIVLGTLVAVPRGWRPTGRPTAEAYIALARSRQPGFAFAAMNFRLRECEPSAGSTPCTLLTTETRVYATDDAGKRRFGRYWRVIYPGSSLIRMTWLRAVRKRAERQQETIHVSR